MSKTILRQIITQCAGTQDIIKKLASSDPCGRNSGLKTVAFLLRLSIYRGVKNLDESFSLKVAKSSPYFRALAFALSEKNNQLLFQQVVKHLKFYSCNLTLTL